MVVDENNAYLQETERKFRNVKYQLLLEASFFVFAGRQLCKAYYPFGLIARRSVPTSLAQ